MLVKLQFIAHYIVLHLSNLDQLESTLCASVSGCILFTAIFSWKRMRIRSKEFDSRVWKPDIYLPNGQSIKVH